MQPDHELVTNTSIERFVEIRYSASQQLRAPILTQTLAPKGRSVEQLYTYPAKRVPGALPSQDLLGGTLQDFNNTLLFRTRAVPFVRECRLEVAPGAHQLAGSSPLGVAAAVLAALFGMHCAAQAVHAVAHPLELPQQGLRPV